MLILSIPESGRDKKTNPVDVVSKRLMSEDIGKVLIKLEERERQVIILRFGLNNGDPLTLKDVGQIFGITRERIRRIEAKALRKLRHSNNLKYLQGYLAS